MIEFTPINIRTWSRLGVCGVFGIAMLELAKADERVVVLAADVVNHTGLKRFENTYPDRIFNLGIAEQNMITVASGLAKEGFVPFATTFACFATLRCADQIKVNMSYMKQNIKLVGSTTGLSASISGSTHMSLDDIGLISALPNIMIVSPADTLETMKAILEIYKYEGAVYLRLPGNNIVPTVYKEDYDFKLGKANLLVEGNEVAIIATGIMVSQALLVEQMLREKGISCKVIDMHTIKPIDTEMLESLLGFKLIVTLEEHNIYGGLGSMVSHYYAIKSNTPKILILGVNDNYPNAGDYNYVLERERLTPEKISERILNEL